MTEYWDLYDGERKPLGRSIERTAPQKPGEYHLSVQIWIHDGCGNWLISRRSPGKLCPLMWEATGGGVIAGENTFQAALREVKEELGIDLDPQKGELFLTLKRDTNRINHPDFLDIWVFEHQCDIKSLTLQAEEVCGAAWASAETIMQMAEEGCFILNRDPVYAKDIFKKYGPNISIP